jgi:putative (di)nucleoside polyphosphate hydrolase|tara:strand:+ start:1833 stop:2303 length:471 start_codon:yes stop_codon:yes gene_type:complete
MQEKILPLRTGVGIVVLNSKNEVFVAKRKDNPIDKWQMPQGGVDSGEDLQSAMYRELLEETSISSIKIVRELDYWLEYLLPDNLIGIIWKGKYRGQKQKWFIVRFLGKDNEININTTNPEFIEWKWLKVKDLENVVVSFKKRVYEKIQLELKEFTE